MMKIPAWLEKRWFYAGQLVGGIVFWVVYLMR